jgi:hypothetical protein
MYSEASLISNRVETYLKPFSGFLCINYARVETYPRKNPKTTLHGSNE